MSGPVTVTGTHRVNEVNDFEGNSEFEFKFNLVPDGQAIIVESHVLFMARGGFVIDCWDESGGLFGVGPSLPISTAATPAHGAMRTCSLMAIHTSARRVGSESQLRRELQQLSIGCDSDTLWRPNLESRPVGFSTADSRRIPSGDVEHGLMIGLMGPVDVFDLVEPNLNVNLVRRRLIVSGHFINIFAEPRFAQFLADPEKSSVFWHATLRDHGGGRVVINEDLKIRTDWPGIAGNQIFGKDPDGRFALFHYALRVPEHFTFGLLTLELKLDDMRAVYELEVQLESPDVLHLPLDPTDLLFRDARINFGNGPAEPGVISTTHNGDMTQRYAYDLGVRVNGSTVKPGTPGDTLESFWSFGQSILSLADGVVIKVFQSTPDNVRGGGDMNKIIVRHDHAVKPRYSAYGHIKQNSAAVSEGDTVVAGQKLAEMGSNGSSSEPHLHLAYYEFDDWGVLRMLPMAFTVSDGGAGSVTGVPRSNQQLQAPATADSGSNRGFWAQLGDFVVEVITAVVTFVKGVFGVK